MCCRVSGVNSLALPLSIVVLACDCSGHGDCQFDSSIAAYNDSYRFQIVECTCDTGYSGGCSAITYYCLYIDNGGSRPKVYKTRIFS